VTVTGDQLVYEVQAFGISSDKLHQVFPVFDPTG
jgi:hypothetical protein